MEAVRAVRAVARGGVRWRRLVVEEVVIVVVVDLVAVVGGEAGS